MHYTKKQVLLKDTYVKESLAYHLPNGGEYLPGIPVFTDYLALLVAEFPYPPYVFVDNDTEQQYSSDKERYYEIVIGICVYLHGGLLCLVKNLTHIDNQ